MVEQDVGVEVAPRELTDERVGPRAAASARPLLRLARRERAEAQVRRDDGGAAGEAVMALVVGVGVALEEAGEHVARGRLPRLDGALAQLVAREAEVG